jgi:hypothetical protein
MSDRFVTGIEIAFIAQADFPSLRWLRTATRPPDEKILIASDFVGGKLVFIKRQVVCRVSTLNVALRPYGSPGNPFWVKGCGGASGRNTNGRPLGSGERKTPKHVADALYQFAKWMTDNFKFELDPTSPYSEAVQILLCLARSNEVPDPIKLGAATAAAKYGPQYVFSKIEIPEFESVKQAESFQLHVSKLKLSGKVDTKAADEAIKDAQTWIANQRADEELEIKRAQTGDIAGDQLIRIEGGMPELPGTSIDMPHKLNGHTIESLPSQVGQDGPAIESNAQEPSTPAPEQ